MKQPPSGSPDLVAQLDKAALGLRVAVVVVTYNRKAQLRRTVQRLLADDIDDLVIVDNASTDGSTDFLWQIDDPRLHVIALPQNRGGAGGFEHGLREAVASYDPDWCLVMDDDARPEPGTLARFRREAGALSAQGWEALAAGVFYPDGNICEMNRPSRNPFWNFGSFWRTLFGGGRQGFHVRDEDYDAGGAVQVDAASFVGLFLSRAAIARAGFPDGDLFIYGDDVLYTLRLTRRGGAIGFAPWLRFEHDCTTFRRGSGQVHRPLWKTYYHHRNLMFVYQSAAGLFYWPILLLILPKWAFKASAYESDWRLYLKLLRIAVGDALRHKLNRTHHEIRVMSRHIDPPQEKAATQDNG